MLPQHDLAIVLRSIQFEERHRIVTALTQENGQITALAKNSVQSRRFGGTLDLFSASEWSFTSKPGSDLINLNEANIREPFEKLRTDFTKLSLASVWSEIMIKLSPKNESCPDLFRLHSNALSVLNQESEETIRAKNIHLLNAYLVKGLQWSGHQPQLDACLQCQITLQELDPQMELSCVIHSAGWICSKCRSQETKHITNREGERSVFHHSLLRVTPAMIADFLLCYQFPMRLILTQLRASQKEHRDLFRFLEALYTFHLPSFDQTAPSSAGGVIKSLRFLGLESTLRHPTRNLQ